MQLHNYLREQFALGRYLCKWVALALPLGFVVGSACAAFLYSLEQATQLRYQYPQLLWGLPLMGALIGGLYAVCGTASAAGTNLIMDEIHDPGDGVPLRMAPLVLVATVMTHLCGGSAGREGTAVQMGGSLASGLARTIPGFDRRSLPTLLMAGVAAGFGGVFGTPVAGMIFALEVLVVGRIDYRAILPCLLAAIVSDRTCVSWGVGHTHYHVASLPPPDSPLHLAPWDARLMVFASGAGILFGLTSRLFAALTHALHALFQRLIAWPLLRPVCGGFVVIGMVQLLGTRDYLGLGVTTPNAEGVSIVSAFQVGGAGVWSWWWKLVFTAVTLGSGFKGGEVTPLFFIGATLGNTLAAITGGPADLFAAMGFVAVFAGATNTPLACTMMAVELFGGEYVVYYAAACLLAYLFSGHAGIYRSQRIGTRKLEHTSEPAMDARSVSSD